MSTVLNGGLGASSKNGDGKNGKGKKAKPITSLAALTTSMVAAAPAKKPGQKMDFAFLAKKPAFGVPDDSESLNIVELAQYVDGRATEIGDWVDAAMKFLIDLDESVQKTGPEVMEAVVEGQSNRSRADDCKDIIERLREFSPENDGELVAALELAPHQKKMIDSLANRVRHMTELHLLSNGLRRAENKETFERLLESAQLDGKPVFVRQTQSGDFQAFGQKYALVVDAFGHYHQLAKQLLAEAITGRSRELAAAHKAEVQEQKKQVTAKTDVNVSPDDLIFGDPETMDLDGKQASYAWSHYGKPNAVRLERQGDRLYVLSAVGMPQQALQEAREAFDKPFVLLDYFMADDGEHLRRGEMEDGKVKYDFGDSRIPKEVFGLVRWVCTAIRATLANRLFEDDEAKVSHEEKPRSAERKPQVLDDNDGAATISPAGFYYRKENHGVGTVTLKLTKGFKINFPEVQNERQEVVAEEHEVELDADTTFKVRRSVCDHRPRIAIIDCDNPSFKKELEVAGLMNSPFIDSQKPGWVGMPAVMRTILNGGYGQAIEAGQIVPSKKKPRK